MSDKELVRLYVKAVVGDKYNVPTVAVLNDPDQAAAFQFPASCCVKPAHLSGHVLFNKEGVGLCREIIKEWFLLNQYHKGRQANYRYIPPKVIVEPLIFGKRYAADCKVLCYKGIPRIIYIVVGRPDRIRFAMFDTAWSRLPFSIDCPAYEHDIPRPRNLDEILAVAAALSRPFDFIRVDLYTDSRTIFVGELTNCPQNALGQFPQDEGEQRVSELIFGA
ncbi:hypothetical protein STHU_07690 [Allostella humosa]|uniref:ATP-grasp fold amidoligase family protein n=1 Tax=Stella humosa TaxID=94 RepID=UPI00113D6EC6|nr:ATP-grasp fold amidoligase family protein [Stella humosa]BBK30135.1 hypothetical protein STHU_07690 [Stella humosa]